MRFSVNNISYLSYLAPVLRNGGAAAAYAVLAIAGLALAIPPGYASPVFPAAGFAVAIVLQLGTGLLPGVALGSLVANLFVAAHQGGFAGPGSAMAVVAAGGAAAQAFAAGRLARRALGDRWRELESERDGLVSWQTQSFQVVLKGGWGYGWGLNWGGL